MLCQIPYLHPQYNILFLEKTTIKISMYILSYNFVEIY